MGEEWRGQRVGRREEEELKGRKGGTNIIHAVTCMCYVMSAGLQQPATYGP